MAFWKIRQPFQRFLSLSALYSKQTSQNLCANNKRAVRSAPACASVSLLQALHCVCGHSYVSDHGICSRLGVQPPLHRLQQQLGVLLQQSQGLVALGSALLVRAEVSALCGGVGQRVQLRLDCQQGLRQDAPHFLLIFTGLLAPLQHLDSERGSENQFDRFVTSRILKLGSRGYLIGMSGEKKVNNYICGSIHQ